jgi:hypothetical protein
MPADRGPTMLASEPIARRPPCGSYRAPASDIGRAIFPQPGRGVLPARWRRFAGGRLLAEVVASVLVHVTPPTSLPVVDDARAPVTRRG